MSLRELRDGSRSVLFASEFSEALSELGWFAQPATPPPPRKGADERGERSGRARTRIIDLPDRPQRLHLRPLRHGGLAAWIWGDRMLGAARGARELNSTALLRARGAPVPTPVALRGVRSGLFWRGELATVHVEDSLDALVFLRSHPSRARVARACAAAGRAVRRVHDAGGRHADLQLANLLLRELAGGSDVVVIDFDKARVGAPPRPGRRMREIMRLYRSLQKHGLQHRVGARGCAAFLSAYVARDRELRRALLDRLTRERFRNAFHTLGYRISR